MMIPPQKPLALITGGARRLGRAIALGLVKEGFVIGLHYHRSEEDATQTASEIQNMGGEVYLFEADLTDPGQILRLFSQVSDLPFSLRVLINSAAEMRAARLGDDTPQAWDATFALNLRAPWLCGRQAYKLMKNNHGVIINISDSGANRAWTGYAAYVLSKSSLEGLTRLQAKEYAPVVRVNAVAPGLILPSDGMSTEAWQRIEARVPIEFENREQAIVQAIVFLIRNEYITGEVVVVDGGYQLV